MPEAELEPRAPRPEPDWLQISLQFKKIRFESKINFSKFLSNQPPTPSPGLCKQPRGHLFQIVLAHGPVQGADGVGLPNLQEGYLDCLSEKLPVRGKKGSFASLRRPFCKDSETTENEPSKLKVLFSILLSFSTRAPRVAGVRAAPPYHQPSPRTPTGPGML